MGWLLVLLAALFEILGSIALKLFSQKRTWLRLAGFISGFTASFSLLYLSFKYLDVSVAYSVWIGIGTAGAVLINMLFLGESKSPWRIISVTIIIIGVVGLKAIS